MPWSNQSGGGSGGGGGGWKGGGGGPWGQPGPGSQPPDLEDVLKRSQDRMKQAMNDGGIPGPVLFLGMILGILVACWFAFFFRVNQDELGVVLRFGQYVRQAEPGLHLRLPFPIEEVLKPTVTRQNKIEVGMRSGQLDRGFGGSVPQQDIKSESLMLTGDENTVDVAFVVYWRIKDAKAYLFNIQNPETTVKEVSESAMREVIGQSNIQPILTEAREKIETTVHDLMQRTLDAYGSGIQVDRVTLQKVDPPSEVIESFRDVQAARADKERLQNEAQSYANKVVPEARGEAERIIQAAEGFKQQTVAEANGQTSRYLKVYEEYKKAPEVTRKRIFLETMERVLGASDKIIMEGNGTQGVVPYLPLDQLNKKRTEGGQ